MTSGKSKIVFLVGSLRWSWLNGCNFFSRTVGIWVFWLRSDGFGPKKNSAMIFSTLAPDFFSKALKKLPFSGLFEDDKSPWLLASVRANCALYLLTFVPINFLGRPLSFALPDSDIGQKWPLGVNSKALKAALDKFNSFFPSVLRNWVLAKAPDFKAREEWNNPPKMWYLWEEMANFFSASFSLSGPKVSSTRGKNWFWITRRSSILRLLVV